jgi:hypothetical protein
MYFGGASWSRAPRLRPSDWRFFIAELAVGALYELEEGILDCGAIECRALRGRAFFFFAPFFWAPRGAPEDALKVDEESTAKL